MTRFSLILCFAFSSLLFAEEPIKVLVYGDSLTAGLGLNKEDAFPAILQDMAKEAGYNIEVINAGVSGDTSSGGLRRLNWTLRQKIDVFLLELGANDGLRGLSVADTKRNLSQIIEKTRKKYPGVKVMLAGMMLPPNMGEQYTSDFQELFPELAKEMDTALIPFLLEGVAGNPKLNQLDGIHPTEEGHQKIAETVWPLLAELLEKQ